MKKQAMALLLAAVLVLSGCGRQQLPEEPPADMGLAAVAAIESHTPPALELTEAQTPPEEPAEEPEEPEEPDWSAGSSDYPWVRSGYAYYIRVNRSANVVTVYTAGAVPVELRLDQRAAAIIPGTPASETDFDTEFLDYILAVGVVDSVDEAVAHVLRHSTGHSDAIITENAENAQKFVDGTDSAAVYVNVSTRFTDGGEFGLGCEMGISTQKLHARGPMGLDELCTYKYIIRGDGQIR